MEETARERYQAEQQNEDTFNMKPKLLGANRGQRNEKLLFMESQDSDSEGEKEEKEGDKQDEEDIADGEIELLNGLGVLKHRVIGQGKSLDSQNRTLGRINDKVSSLVANLDNLVSVTNMRSQTEKVDDQVSHPWRGGILPSTVCWIKVF